MVLATHGPHEIDVPAGLSVAVSGLFTVMRRTSHPDAEALVGSEIVPESYVLKDGDDLHFIHASGRKGVGEQVWTAEQFGRFFQITPDDLQAWIAQGLKVKRCSDGSIRITETAVDDFFRGQEATALDLNGHDLLRTCCVLPAGVQKLIRRCRAGRGTGERRTGGLGGC